MKRPAPPVNIAANTPKNCNAELAMSTGGPTSTPLRSQVNVYQPVSTNRRDANDSRVILRVVTELLTFVPGCTSAGPSIAHVGLSRTLTPAGPVTQSKASSPASKYTRAEFSGPETRTLSSPPPAARIPPINSATIATIEISMIAAPLHVSQTPARFMRAGYQKSAGRAGVSGSRATQRARGPHREACGAPVPQ